METEEIKVIDFANDFIQSDWGTYDELHAKKPHYNVLKLVGSLRFSNSHEFWEWVFSKFNCKVLDLSELKVWEELHVNFDMYSLEKKYCFKSDLSELILPDDMKTVLLYVSCNRLIRIVGKGIEYVQMPNRERCPSLEEIVVGSHIKVISPPSKALIRESPSSNLKKITILPSDDGQEIQLSPYAFADNMSLEEVVFPSNISVLPNRVFEGCINLKKISGGNIKEIGFGAFGGCVNLKVVPFKRSMLNESHFLSVSSWESYYKPENTKNLLERVIINGIETFRDEPFLRPIERPNTVGASQWDSFKKGVFMDNKHIWCFTDKSLYYIKQKDIPSFSNKIHHYVEFKANTILLKECSNDSTEIEWNPGITEVLEARFPSNHISEEIDCYFSADLETKELYEEMKEKVDSLDIEMIINSYHEEVEHSSWRNSDWPDDQEWTISRSSCYTDDYLNQFIPNFKCHIYKSCTERDVFEITGYLPHSDSVDSFYKKKELLDEVRKVRVSKLREKAFQLYNKDDHIRFLVNQQIKVNGIDKNEIEYRYNVLEGIRAIENHVCCCYSTQH